MSCNDKKEKTINQKNMEEEILKSIKKYDNKPYYIAKVQAHSYGRKTYCSARSNCKMQV